MIDTVTSIQMTTYEDQSDPIWIQDFNILFKKERLTEFFPTKTQTNEERINSIVRLSLYASIVLSIYHSNVKYSAIFIFFLFFTFVIYKHHPEINPKSKELNKINLNTQQLAQLEAERLAASPDNNSSLNNFTPSLGLNASKNKLGTLVSADGKTVQSVGLTTIEHFEGGEKRGEQNKNGTCTTPTLDNPFMNVTMKDYMNFDADGSIVDRPPACDPSDPTVKNEIETNFNNNLFRDVNDVFGKSSSQRQFFTMPWTTVPNKQDEFARWLYLSPATCKENSDNCLNYEDIRGKPFIFPNAFRNPNSTGARLKENTSQGASKAHPTITKK
jgi:Family of unknown function (DUF5762)